jgi:hypothetical protein
MSNNSLSVNIHLFNFQLSITYNAQFYRILKEVGLDSDGEEYREKKKKEKKKDKKEKIEELKAD